jgi:LEA14-like dessication related protein
MKKRLLVLVAIGLSTLSGCAALQQLLRGAFQRPRLTFKTARLAQASLADATVDLVYELENPNPIGLSLASVDYAFFVEDKQVVAGSPARGLQLKANGRSELVFPANVRFADIVPVVATFLTKDAARYKAQGSIGFNTPLGVLSFPLQTEGTFPVPKPPQIQFESPRITNISLAGATVEFPLVVTNRNPFPLPVADIRGALRVGGANVGQLGTGNMGLLEAGATKQLALPLNINFAGALQAASAISSGRGQVAFNAQLVSNGQSVPVDVNQVVNFLKQR